MMEKDYKPDGWLGMIVGAKLWIDFRDKHKVTSGLGKLVKELKDRGRQVQEEPVQGEDVNRPFNAVLTFAKRENLLHYYIHSKPSKRNKRHLLEILWSLYTTPRVI